MRRALILACLPLNPALAAVSLDRDFWETYRPYQQYSHETIDELIALDEGDLLETARDIDGLELRIVGRTAANAALVSVRVVIDSVARQRLQFKQVPYALSPNAGERPTMRRRQLDSGQTDSLLRLLEQSQFWDAPYRPRGIGDGAAGTCSNAGHWIVEAVRPGGYQLITREDCGNLDPLVRQLRDLLLEFAGA